MNYSRFIRHARCFSKHYAGDLVHDVWLRYYEKHNKDLFKEDLPNSWIEKTMRNEYINSLFHANKFTGITVKRVIEGEEFEEEIIADKAPLAIENIIGDEIDGLNKDKIRKGVQTSIDNFNNAIPKDSNLVRLTGIDFYKKCKLFFSVYDLMKIGYNTKDISQTLNMSTDLVRYYKNKIKKYIKYMALNNPFNGSKVIVKKSISENCWNEKSEEERQEFDLDDENEYFKLFVYRASGDGWLVRLKSPKDGLYKKAFEKY